MRSRSLWATGAFLTGLLAAEAAKFETTPAPGGPRAAQNWTVGTPIVTYWAGPSLTDAVARQMAEGGFNLVWCTEQTLEVAQRHGLRAQLQHALLTPASLDTPSQREQLDALLERVRQHPALYSYYLTDEPSAGAFRNWGRLVSHLRERDPARLAYINLFPTYANNQQLGTQGDTVTAYREHLRLYRELVRPALISYDHYQFAAERVTDQYFLNLSMIRDAAQAAGVPFLNIVQACTWTPSMRVPSPNEMRYLVYTTLAYGAQGISYYVYCHPGHTGGIALADGTPTPIYHALKSLNREFIAIARELQPLRSLAVWHYGTMERGCTAAPADAAFRLTSPPAEAATRGFLLGGFGRMDQPSHAVVVNLDCASEATAVVSHAYELEVFDATREAWTAGTGSRIELPLPPGGGRLVRVKPR